MKSEIKTDDKQEDNKPEMEIVKDRNRLREISALKIPFDRCAFHKSYITYQNCGRCASFSECYNKLPDPEQTQVTQDFLSSGDGETSRISWCSHYNHFIAYQNCGHCSEHLCPSHLPAAAIDLPPRPVEPTKKISNTSSELLGPIEDDDEDNL